MLYACKKPCKRGRPAVRNLLHLRSFRLAEEVSEHKTNLKRGAVHPVGPEFLLLVLLSSQLIFVKMVTIMEIIPKGANFANFPARPSVLPVKIDGFAPILLETAR
jgi:hypothetical protein